MKTILQVPLDSTLRKEAEKEALEQGFSSLQEFIRVILKKLAQSEIQVKIEDAIQLSPRAIKRYEKITRDFKAGKNVYTVKSVDELMKHLHE